MDLYIARHGETRFNMEGRFQGSGKDSPLTPSGLAQARALGYTLSMLPGGMEFDAVYSSPLGRAVSTVGVVFGGGVRPILDSRIVEIGLGDMEGVEWREAQELFPESMLSDPVAYKPPPNGESLPDMLKRVGSFMDDVAKKGYKRVFVLSHGYTCRVFQAAAMGGTVQDIENAQRYNNCDIAHYKYENGQWRLIRVIPSDMASAPPAPRQKELLHTKKALAPTFILFAFITALLYTISFTGMRVFPMVSFFFFCGLTTVLLFVLLKRLGWLNHPRAFLWAVPLMILASFNMIFAQSVFTYINVAAAWVLFAFIIFGAIHGAKYPFGALYFWVTIVKVIIGNIGAGVQLLLDACSAFKLDRKHPALRFLIGIVIALPLLIVILALMISADQVFANLLNNILDSGSDINGGRLVGHVITIIIVTVFAAGYVYKAKFVGQADTRFTALSLDKIIAMSFLLAINLLFLVFCYIQLAYLFMGGFGRLPGDIVFADYAREGFFQLLFLTIINFAVIIIFLQVYSHHARVGIVRFMLVLLTLFTCVLIASSFYRMNMYMGVFGFTPLRLSVITFLVMAVFLCVATLVALFRDKFDVMRMYLIIGMVFLVVANVSGSGFVSARLNAWLYRTNPGYHFTMRDHFWSADNAGGLMEVYRLSGYDASAMKDTIRGRLASYYRAYADEPWQNRSIIKRIYIRQIREFLH